MIDTQEIWPKSSIEENRDASVPEDPLNQATGSQESQPSLSRRSVPGLYAEDSDGVRECTVGA